MKQYLVGNKLLDFTEIIYLAPNGDDSNDGLTTAKPKATVANALATLYSGVTRQTDINPAIVFLKGEYHLPTVQTNNANIVARFYSESFNCNYIGQGKDTVIYCDNVSNSINKTSRGIIYGAAGTFYRLWFKINPYSYCSNGDAVALLAKTGYSTNFPEHHQFYNCAFENISGKPESKVFNLAYNTGSYAKNHCFINCVTKTGYTWVFSSKENGVKSLTNCLVDRVPQGAFVESFANTITRTVTEDDLLTGSAQDITAAAVGLYANDYAWGPSSVLYRLTVNFELENGEKLQKENEYLLETGEQFSLTAQMLPGYTYVGYKLDDSDLQSSETILIDAIDSDHIVTFIYQEEAKEPQPSKDYLITEKYQDEEGNPLQADTTTLVEEGDGYYFTAPAIKGYKCLGYYLNDIFAADEVVVLDLVNLNMEIIFVYQQDNSDDNNGNGNNGGNDNGDDDNNDKGNNHGNCESKQCRCFNSFFNIEKVKIGKIINKCCCGLGSSNNTNTDTTPAGAVWYFAMPEAPPGWLVCDGTELSRSEYANLFSAIDTTFGEGDGETTFKLPDLRGEFIRGYDQERGIDIEREFGSYQKGSIIPLDTTKDIIVNNGLYHAENNNSTEALVKAGLDKPSNYAEYAGMGTATQIVNSYVGLTASNMSAGVSRPRNIALLPCIKY